jgi:hypothetical protein
MKSVRCECENGYKWETSVSDSSTFKSVSEYFVGQMVNTACYPNEVMSKCNRVQLIG